MMGCNQNLTRGIYKEAGAGTQVWVCCPDAGGKSVGFFILRIGGICNPILLPTQRHLWPVYSEQYQAPPRH